MRSVLTLLLLLFCAYPGGYGQTTDSTAIRAGAARVSADTVAPFIATMDTLALDTAKRDTNWVLRAKLRTKQLVPPVFRAQTRPPFDPDIAWKRALLFPGWGQMYNHSYWKLPLVYGGLAAAGYLAYHRHKLYKGYQFAYRVAVDTVFKMRVDSMRIDGKFISLAGKDDEGLRRLREQYHKSRDKMVINLLIVYGVSAVEAYVDAHLKAFDVGNDITLHVAPCLLPPQNGGSPMPSGTGVRLSIGW